MKKFLLLLLAFPVSPAVEHGRIQILGESGSKMSVRIYFSAPFKSFPKISQPCSVKVDEPGGHGQVKNYTLEYVDIQAEVGDHVQWTCMGER